MIERSLMRPRDLLQFCQLAIEQAQMYRHEMVHDADVLVAEHDYSDYMFQALRLEYLHLYPRLDEVIFEFVAWRRQGPLQEAISFIEERILGGKYNDLPWVMECQSDPVRLLGIFYEVGFCGMEDTERQLRFYSFDRPFTETMALCHGHPIVTIHPAFHRALELA